MFIYFFEQVWTQGFLDYAHWNWYTKETQARYWDDWAAGGYAKKHAYPSSHMELNNDYIEW